MNEVSRVVEATHFEAEGKVFGVEREIVQARVHATVESTRDGEGGNRDLPRQQFVASLRSFAACSRDGARGDRRDESYELRRGRRQAAWPSVGVDGPGGTGRGPDPGR